MKQLLTLLAMCIVLFLSATTSGVLQALSNIGATVTRTNITCRGANDGSFTVSNPTGGAGPYETKLNAEGTWYSVSSGSPKVFTGLCPGQYIIYLRETTAPLIKIAIANITFSEPSNGCTILEPIRMSVTSPTLKPDGETLIVDLLQSNGSDFTPDVTINKGTVVTDDGGVLTFVLDGSVWGIPYGVTYSSNFLVRVTYGGIVLSIERLEVVYGKQGLYGAYITTSDIKQDENFNVGKFGILENSADPTESAEHTYFQGADQADEITYTLPAATPTIDGQVLTSTTSGGMSWTTPEAGSGGGILNVHTVNNTDYTVQADDDVIISTTNSQMRTITFPSATTCAGRVIYVISRGSYVFRVLVNGIEILYDHTNNPDNSGLFGTRGVFVSDGTNWYEIYGDFVAGA